jgi:predicted neuraminidase
VNREILPGLKSLILFNLSMITGLLAFFFGISGMFIPDSGKNPILMEEFVFSEAPFPSCHASTIAESGDNYVVAFFGGTHEKHEDVEIWISILENGKWTDPFSVADGMSGGKRYPCWNPVLYQVLGGDLLLFYKVGPDPQSWWGMKKRSENGGKTWSDADELPEGMLGPIKNKPVLLQNGMLLCPSSTEDNGWKVHMEFTPDFGSTWQPKVIVDPPSEYEVIQPTILQLENGWLEILCRSKNGLIIRSFSTDQGKSWGVLEPLDLPNPNSGIDAVTLADGRHLLVYNHSKKPVDEWGGERFPLNIALSDDGITWKASIILEQDPGEYSYPAIIQDKKGLVHVVYTWNREKIKHIVLDPEELPSGNIRVWDRKE